MMSNGKKSFVFFGNERLATGVTTTTPILNALISNEYIPSLIVVNDTTSKSRKNRELEILHVAKTHSIPVLNTKNNEEIYEHIIKSESGFAILAAYGRIIPQTILDAFAGGIINIHPSLLPKHRGPTPIESVILNGEKLTGVSIIKLVKAMDAGPIYLQHEIQVASDVSKQELCDKLSELAAKLLTENLDKILNDEIKPVAQDNSVATYDSLIQKQDGLINWSKSAEIIEREIRAFSEWPKSRTTLGSVEVVITKAHYIPVNNPVLNPGQIESTSPPLVVQAKDGQLCIEKLIPAGKKEMGSAAFLAGYKDKIA